jgi:hypothetical protein
LYGHPNASLREYISMADDKKQNEKDELENARIGYQSAIALQTAEIHQTWSRHTVMTMSHTVLLSAMFLILSNKGPNIYSILLSMFGLCICIIWFLTYGAG